MEKLPLILASGSPRRKEILATMGLEYTIDVPQVDEQTSGKPRDMVLELSQRKARAVAARHSCALVLAADTLVSIDEEVLGKPASEADAVRMLGRLSNAWHEVYTGLTLVNTKTGRILSRVDCTRVHFVQLSDQEILSYVESTEPMDKAGAYAIQGRAGMYIDRIEGSYSNVVGLPMALLHSMIGEMTEEEN